MPKVTIDGHEIEVSQGTTIMQATKQLAIEVPYYCWHPGLSVAGNCRMCLVDVEGPPKPQIACYTQVTEGMVVHTQSEKAKKARKGTLEFLLSNHPLDCPVCDQAGECDLQNFYMDHGQYDSRFDEQKHKKKKAQPVGENVMLDQERCVLCSRCVRFCDEITGTGELGIVNRGSHEEITVFPGKEVNNAYSGNVVDICPVGALTDRDFRFKCRVWYLSSQDSVCPGCSQGCNIRIDSNLSRPQHGEGERVMRLKPRENLNVNDYWMCDEGRYNYNFIDRNRIQTASRVKEGVVEEILFEDAVDSLASVLGDAVREQRHGRIGVLVSTQLTNEDLFFVKKFFKTNLGMDAVESRFSFPEGSSDDFLIKADKSPNTAGAQALEVIASGTYQSGEDLIDKTIAGEFDVLISFGVDIDGLLGKEKLDAILEKVTLLAYVGSNHNETSKKAQLVIPSTVYAEKDGTFTNVHGRVQRIWPAFPPLGQARPEWQIICDLSEKTGFSVSADDAESIFSEITQTVSSFQGLSYEKLGKEGSLLSTVKETVEK